MKKLDVFLRYILNKYGVCSLTELKDYWSKCGHTFILDTQVIAKTLLKFDLNQYFKVEGAFIGFKCIDNLKAYYYDLHAQVNKRVGVNVVEWDEFCEYGIGVWTTDFDHLVAALSQAKDLEASFVQDQIMYAFALGQYTNQPEGMVEYFLNTFNSDFYQVDKGVETQLINIFNQCPRWINGGAFASKKQLLSLPTTDHQLDKATAKQILRAFGQMANVDTQVIEKQMNQEYGLIHCLAYYSVAELKKLCKARGIKGYSKWTKNEVLLHLYEHIMTVFDWDLLGLTDEHMILLSNLDQHLTYEHHNQIANDLINLGLAYLFYDKTRPILYCPPDLLDIVDHVAANKVNVNFQDPEVMLLDFAMKNFGVIKVQDLLNWFHHHGFTQVNKDDLKSYSSASAFKYCDQFDLIYTPMMEDFYKVIYDKITLSAKGLDYHTFDKTMIDTMILEGITPIHDAFMHFSDLVTPLDFTDVDVIHFSQDIMMMDLLGIGINDMVESLIESGDFNFGEAKTLKTAIRFYLDHCPQWSYRGHTREEAKLNLKPKMGRNDLCSCGSGKKYKKCCGR